MWGAPQSKKDDRCLAPHLPRCAAKHTPAKLSDDAAEATLTLGMTIPVNKQQDPKVGACFLCWQS